MNKKELKYPKNFYKLPIRLRRLIIKYANQDSFYHKENKYSTLASMFIFSSKKEGFDYWERIRRVYKIY